MVELDDDVHIKGMRNVVVDGEATLRVGGDYVILVEGNKRETILGNRTRPSTGTRRCGSAAHTRSTWTARSRRPRLPTTAGTAGGDIIDAAP